MYILNNKNFSYITLPNLVIMKIPIPQDLLILLTIYDIIF